MRVQFQMGSSQCKRRLGEALFTKEAKTEEVVSHDCDTYLRKLHTLMIAYALAGVAGVTEIRKAFVLGANSAGFVKAALPEGSAPSASRQALWLGSSIETAKREGNG